MNLKECQKVGGRIISIHSRRAVSKIASSLNLYPDCGIPILHWFSGSLTELNKMIEMGCYFSVNAVMLNYSKGKSLIAKIPKDLVLPESDGPFAIIKNEIIMPWEAINICSQLSSIWRVSSNEAQHILNTNFKTLSKSYEGF